MDGLIDGLAVLSTLIKDKYWIILVCFLSFIVHDMFFSIFSSFESQKRSCGGRSDRFTFRRSQ